MESQIQIVNPTAQREYHEKNLARRAPDLRGKTIGLLDNSKPNADKFLERVGELLKREYRDVKIVSRRKNNRTEADCLPELLQTCDAVVTAFAD
jgi:hypothetical protein